MSEQPSFEEVCDHLVRVAGVAGVFDSPRGAEARVTWRDGTSFSGLTVAYVVGRSLEEERRREYAKAAQADMARACAALEALRDAVKGGRVQLWEGNCASASLVDPARLSVKVPT